MKIAIGRALPLALAVGALAAAASAAAPGQPYGRAAQPVEAALPATATTVVCPPAPRIAEGVGEGADPAFAAQPVASTVTARGTTYTSRGQQGELSGRTLPGEGEGDRLEPASDGLAVLSAGSGAGDAPLAITADPADDTSRPVGAMTTTLTAQGDLAGLAVNSCASAAASSWLVGGGISPGRSSRIVLANPGPTAATVNLTVLTTQGPQRPAAGQDVVVSPGNTKELLLQALLDEDGPTAIGVAASGGRVAASLVDAQLDGITPRGVEQLSASVAAQRQVLAPLSGNVSLRLANPGAGTAKIAWRVLGRDGTVASQEASGAAVPPGSVVEAPLTMPDEGAGLVVTSDDPVLASALMTRAGPAGAADNAVVSPGTTLDGTSLVMPAPTGRTTLALAAGDDPATVVVRQVNARGAPATPDRTLAIPPDSVRALVLGSGVSVAEVSVRAGQVHGGLLVEDGPDRRFIAATPVQDAATGARSVQVLVTR